MGRLASFVLAFAVLVAPSTFAQTGSITGTLTLPGFEAETNLPSIEIYDSSGTLVRTWASGTIWTTPESDSIAWSITGLQPGIYFARTTSRAEIRQPVPFRPSIITAGGGYWVNELFDNIPCIASDCDPLRGKPITVSAGSVRTDVNFALEFGAQILGTIPPVGLSSTDVDVHDSRGVLLPGRANDHALAGTYAAYGLTAGTYYLVLRQPASVRAVLYKDMPCNGCAVTSGTPISLTAGEQKTGVNFSLLLGTKLTGTVRSNASASPPNQPLNSVVVRAYAVNGDVMFSDTTTADGTYSLLNLAPGTFRVSAANVDGFVDQSIDGVTVTASGDTTGIDFALAPGQSIAGTITSGSGPVANADVLFYTTSPAAPAGRATSNSSGGYTATLPQGTYYVETVPLRGYVQQIYNGVVCPQASCSTATATPVTLGSTARTGIDVSLASCAPPAIAPVRLAEAAVGGAYRQTLLASGANGSVRFVVSSGTLPPGLSLDPDSGVLSGTPTTSGHFTFTIAAADTAGCAGSLYLYA